MEPKAVVATLAEQVEPYDSADIVAAIAALQLMPANAGRAIRLEALAHAAMSVRPASGRRPPSPGRLRQICRSPELAALAPLEDPCDNPFTEDFTSIGGSYTAFSGILEEPTYVLRQLGKAIILGRQPFPNPDFVRQASQLFRAILGISEALAKKAGLPRGSVPTSVPGGDIIVPPSSELARLKSCVTFTTGEISHLLGKARVPPSVLDGLVSDIGSLSPGSYGPDSHPLTSAPIAKHEDRLIVACPGLLLAALRHRLITLATELDVTEELVQRFHLAVWQSVVDSLGYLQARLLADRRVPVDRVPLHEGVFAFDNDKALYVQLVTDDFSGYDATCPLSRWDLDDLGAVIRTPLREAEVGILGGAQPPNEMFTLLLLQGVGRPHAGSLNAHVFHAWMRNLIMTAADLETIALLEGGDSLFLWKYAGAYERIRRSIMITTTSALDEFQLYRARDYSYYISDEKPPNGMWIAPGGAGALRREVIAKFDRHGVPSYRKGFATEVAALGGDTTFPVYFPFADLGERATLRLETKELPVWVTGPDYAEDPRAEGQHSDYALLVETVCYWLWQFQPWLSEAFRHLAQHIRFLLVEVQIHGESGDQGAKTLPIDRLDVRTIRCDIDAEQGRLRLDVDLRAFKLFATQDNKGERYLMQQILVGLSRLLDEFGETGLLDERTISETLDSGAPLGQKKKLLVLDQASNPELDPTDLPRFRKIQSADVHEVLDELGAYLKNVKGLLDGPVPQPGSVLNQAVEFLYSALERLVATLSPDGLLEWLIGQEEAAVRQDRRLRLTMPTRLACFGDHAGLVADLVRQLPEAETTWLSSRFIIEYVAACPPTGLRPISLSVYDTLLALASQIVHWACVSDLIWYRVADIQVMMLPSGRLGASHEAYLEPRARYMSSYVAGEISRVSTEFGRFWREVSRDEERTPSTEDLDSAFFAEFGYALSELADMAGVILSIGYEQAGPVKRLPLDALIERLVAELAWSAERVGNAIDLLSLEAREDFLKPRPPFRNEDVYPWRFNRALSYLRRPLLKRESGEGTEVLWGNRHLHTSIAHLVDLCVSGRLKAKSAQMTTLMSHLSKERGDRFNAKVAAVFEAHEGLVVRQRVKKVGRLRIEGPEGSLGDIDVLVASPVSQRLMAVETKDRAIARNPSEVAREIESLFIDKANRPCVVSRHQKRVNWTREHLDEVLSYLKIARSGRWRVDAVLVVDEEILSPYFAKSAIKVVSIAQLREYISKWAH